MIFDEFYVICYMELLLCGIKYSAYSSIQYFLENKLIRLYLKPASSYTPIYQYAPIFKQVSPLVTFPRLKKNHISGTFGPQKMVHLSCRKFICYRYMCLFSSSNGVQVPYVPILDGRLLLSMSLFSKKHSVGSSPGNDQSIFA